MSTEAETADYIVEQLAGLPDVYARRMFGEYALYCNGRVVGLICDNTLFVKISEPGRKFVGKFYQEGFAYKGAKASMQIDEDLIDDKEWLRELILTTAKNVPITKKKRKAL